MPNAVLRRYAKRSREAKLGGFRSHELRCRAVNIRLSASLKCALLRTKTFPLDQNNHQTILNLGSVDEPCHSTLSLNPYMLKNVFQISGDIQLTIREKSKIRYVHRLNTLVTTFCIHYK